MTLYEELENNLLDFNNFYRIQGGNSYNCIWFNSDNFYINSGNYVYVSKTMEHHKYFLNKRIKQLIDERIFFGISTLENDRYSIRQKDISDAIKWFESRTNNIYFESHRIKVFPCFSELLSQNCILTKNKKSGTNFVEKVDVSNGTGYGVSDEWLELLKKFIVLIARKKLVNKDIIEYLKLLRSNSYRHTKYLNIDTIINNGHLNYALNTNLNNSFTKYDIIYLLESILEKGLITSTSDLAVNPKDTIKRIANEYQEGRTYILNTLDSISKKRCD